MLVAGGATNVTTYFVLRLAADGTVATGLTVTDFDLQYVRSGVAPAAKVDATALGATDTAHTDNYAIEVDATDQPGLYRVDWPDAAFAAGVREVILTVKCALTFVEHLRVEIDAEVSGGGGGASAAAIADAVWDEAQSGHTSADTFGALAAEIAVIDGIVDTILLDTAELQIDDIPAKIAALDAVVDTVKVDTAAILVDTNELQGDWTDGGRLDLIIDLAATNHNAILADTNELQGDWANGGRLDTILDNIETDTGTTLDGKINTIDGIVDDILTDTGTTVPNQITALNNVSTAEVNAQVDAAIETYHLDHLFHADYDPSSKPGHANALLNELVEDDSGVSRFTVNALENGPSGSGASAGAIADAVWDEAQGDHTGGTTFGALAAEIATIDGKVDTIDNFLDTEIAAILADTNELQGDWVDGGRLDALVDSIKAETATIVADTNELQTDWANSGRLDALVDSIKAETVLIVEDTGTTVPALINGLNDVSTAEVNTQVDLALTDIHLDHLFHADYDPASKPGNATALLNELVEDDSGVSRFTTNALENAPSGGASASAIADAVWDETQSTHVAVGSFGILATEIADILVDTDATVPGLIATLDAVVDTVKVDTAAILVDTAALAAVPGLINVIVADTNELQTDWADGGRLDLLIDTIDTVVDAIKAETVLIVEDTGTTVPGLINGLNDVSTAEVNTEVDAALVGIHLDHLFAEVYDPASKPGNATALLNEIVESDSGVSRFTVNALENGPTGSGASAATIADAVWDELQTDHVAVGSFGIIASEIATIDWRVTTVDGIVDTILLDTAELQTDNVPGLISTLSGKVDTVDGIVDTILVDTNELQTDWVDGGRLDALVDSIKAETVLIVEDTGTTVPGLIATLDAVVDTVKVDTAAILIDTDELQSDNIPGSLSAIDGKIDIIDDFLDTEIAAILEDTGTTLPGLIATLDAVVDTVKAETVLILEDTGTTVPGLIAALNDISTAQVNAEVDTALADIHLDHLFATDYNPASPPGTTTALLNELIESDGGVSRFTANALENGGGGGATAAAIADAVWDETSSDHDNAGSFGGILYPPGGLTRKL